MKYQNEFNHRLVKQRGVTKYFKNLSENGYTLFAVSITYKHPRRRDDSFNRSHSGLSVDTLNKILHSIYIGLCKTLVHEHNFARPSYRNLMPELYATAEKDGNCELHHHAILAVRSDIASRVQPLFGENTLCRLHDSVKTSDIKPIWFMDGWSDYVFPEESLWETSAWFSPKCQDALEHQPEVVQ